MEDRGGGGVAVPDFGLAACRLRVDVISRLMLKRPRTRTE